MTMQPQRLPSGFLLVPRRAEGDGIIGDGFVEIGPDDPEWETWNEEVTRDEKVAREDAEAIRAEESRRRT